MRKPRKEHTFEREQIKLHLNGLSTSIGAYLRARREQFNMGWKDLADKTNIQSSGILRIERGKSFPFKSSQLKELFDALKIRNGENLADLMMVLQDFQAVIKQKRFKL
jgi:ribosome-binding protein aMBF1 (putative translation factor)